MLAARLIQYVLACVDLLDSIYNNYNLHYLFFRLLKQTEIVHGMQRWKPDLPGYKLVEQHVQRRKQSLIKQRIEVCARERWFLLAMKAKYAGNYSTK